ncbi:MAG: lyase family protein [Pyrobaculum arsenaticum]|uniref:Fumarase n=2 Tax=Pyrobaculum arsenaticum TaxID=121277 RepID=A4WID6_PYRAR|nr:lyase family protein [Pyrobaculum arsenaticum]ABP50153.1 fumarase [Pyrobaculum arsenaticum DSM 13514]MCY0889707.1 lyase family protein [Pyrobaculum arsenaticum]NYR14920.1 fumarate hydratase [Pyrobaculum arsenaticum]
MGYVTRARRLFLESGERFRRDIVWAMGVVKLAAARANAEFGLLSWEKANAIIYVARELMEGVHDGRIVVDVFQTGSGTGLNMNVNEVIARRAFEKFGISLHPNDDVNLGQSSNDVVPTAIRIAVIKAWRDRLKPALVKLVELLEAKADEFKAVVKAGRTHLRDALPVTLGQELSGYRDAFARDLKALEALAEFLREVPIGGTAVGTGVNAHPLFGQKVVEIVNAETGLGIKRGNPFTGMRLLTDLLIFSGGLRALGVDMQRLCQDLRLMFSGPYTGLGEIDLPSQADVPGSSAMPGKVNPVTLEAAMQAAAYVLGLDEAVKWAASLGEFELAMGIPVIGWATIREMEMLAEAAGKVAELAILDMRPNVDVMRNYAERSAALITLLAPIIGYDKARELAGRPLREVLKEAGLSDAEIEDILNPVNLTTPGFKIKSRRG